jgi:four helix bundle protein
VASNIVEGCSRNGETEYIRFLEISFGSLKELHYQFTIAVRMAYVPPDEVTRLEEKFIEAEKVLSSLIRQLRKLYPKT